MKTFSQILKEFRSVLPISEGFTPAQIKKLQQEFGKIKRVDPTSPAMQKVTKLVVT